MIVKLKNVAKSYGDGEGVVKVLEGLDFCLEERETVSIVGTSGCGKSTLLNIIGTLDTATAGEVRLFGDDVRGLGGLLGVRVEGGRGQQDSEGERAGLRNDA